MRGRMPMHSPSRAAMSVGPSFPGEAAAWRLLVLHEVPELLLLPPPSSPAAVLSSPRTLAREGQKYGRVVRAGVAEADS